MSSPRLSPSLAPSSPTPSPRVLLVSMPWSSLSYPSPAIGTLQAQLHRAGVHCDAWYAGFDLVRSVGLDTYEALSHHVPNHLMVGEWLFARSLWGRSVTDEDEVRSWLLDELNSEPGLWDALMEARIRCEEFIDAAADRAELLDYDMIGFTSTFQQNAASLALARRLKERSSATTIAFGGANWEAEMGLTQLEQFDFVDLVALGDADVTVEALARASVSPSHDVLASIPGIAFRFDGVVEQTGPSRPFEDLDSLPTPEYQDWVDQLDRSGLRDRLTPHLSLETSRGCWWGARSHCTFCGLNGGGMSFRSRSPELVHEDLHRLRDRYGISRIEMVDNIVDTRYFHNLLPQLAEERASGDEGFDIFYEIKSTLTHAQLRTLAAAGCRRVQPGIESLSDHVLDLMGKGTSALQNLQVLRWMFELGIEPDWNVLWGFPGETVADYEEMAALVENFMFLPPPVAAGSVRVDRFSPFFERPDDFGLVDLRPFSPYRNVYPFDDEVLAGIAYYFEHSYRDGRDDLGPAAVIQEAVERWRIDGDPGGVWMEAADDGSVRLLDDRRSTGASRSIRWEGWRAELYLACDRARSLDEMRPIPIEADEIRRQAFLDWCVRERLMVTDGTRWLAVAVHTPARTDPDHPGLRHTARVPWRLRGVGDRLSTVAV